MAFDTNVFINCPFDDDYRPILRSLVFISLYCGLNPQVSETISSGHIRINKIKQLIADSKFAIRDLSRSRPLRKNDLPRFNMPYELGLDIGCCEFGTVQQKSKSILILETEHFHYQSVLSDIAGQDISRHHDDPQLAMKGVRDWLSKNGFPGLPGTAKIWLTFNLFIADLELKLSGNFTKEEIDSMPTGNFLSYARDWINNL